jgi:hypothetical protein
VTTSYAGLIRLTTLAAGLAAGASLSGCSRGDGLSDYDRMKQAQQGAADTLAGAGAKVKAMNYTQGSAWAVNLSGATLSDDLLRQAKALGNVSELDLSRTTVTDDQLGLISEIGLGTLLLKFDLSHTGVTDAGLDKMQGFLLLSELNLTGTKVTPAAVERFKKARQQDQKVRIKNTTVRR